MKLGRSQVVATTQNRRLAVLRRIRQDKAFDAPADFVPAGVPELLVIEAGEHYLRTARLARLAAGDTWPAFHRVAVIALVTDAVQRDFISGDSTAVDAIYRLLAQRKEEPE